MEQIAFNLLQEPWIRVMRQDGSVQECSLTQALLDSHKYQRLAGELPTQDAAVLRLLLAVLHTVFYRVDPDAESDPIDSRAGALRRWQALWSAGSLPEKPLREYLERWKERFWLFHPEHPFYQVPDAAAGTRYSAAKLNGELSESSNKLRLFPARAGESKSSLSYAEAARWLLYLNGFDDTSAKPKGKGLPSPGAGWLGKLGLIYAEGGTLFETLLLNLVLLQDGSELWSEPRPVWERDKPKSAERTEIPMPENQAELLTLQSRRLLLEREADRVVGYSLLGGDFFSKINASAEQMTLWDRRSGKKNEPPYDQPRRLSPERQMWRDFGVITGAGAEGKIPGVVRWIALLKSKRVLERDRVIRLRTAGVKYGDKDFFVEDILADHLDFHAGLLEEAGKLWTDLVQQKILQTERAAWLLGDLAKELFLAEGGQPDSRTQEARAQLAKQAYYAAVDLPFRAWLCAIDPAQGDDETLRMEKDEQWSREACQIALTQGRRMVQSAGEAAFIGRWRKNGNTEREICFSSPAAFQRFAARIRKCFALYHQENSE